MKSDDESKLDRRLIGIRVRLQLFNTSKNTCVGERERDTAIVVGVRMPPWTATLVVVAVLVEAALCDDLTTSASRRKLTRFELGHEDNKICWEREGKDGFYTVIDSHNHFRFVKQINNSYKI